MDTPLSWRTETRKVKDLVEYKGNPRKISDKQMEGLKNSLTKFSLAEIPAVNLDGTVLAGNQRLKALLLMGKADEEIDGMSTKSQALEERSRGIPPPLKPFWR